MLFKAGATLGAAVVLVLGACSRDSRNDSGDLTAAEQAAFTAPADSSLTVEQVDRYLRTVVAQLELMQAEAPAMRQRLAAARHEREQTGRGERARSPQALLAELSEAAFVRAARRQRYEPAELWYVRIRLSQVSGYLLASRMHDSRDEAAELFRQQAAAMRGAPGVTQAQIDAMLQAAAQAEQQTERPPSPRLAQNLETLRRARGALSDSAWGRVAAVAAGMALPVLDDLPEAEVQHRLEKLRQLHLHALENREPGPG